MKSPALSSWKRGGRRYCPYVYTEQGIIALAGVLRSPVADRMVVEISRAFVAMRRLLSNNPAIAEQISHLQNRQIIFENETTDKLNMLFSYVDERTFPRQMTFFDGEWFDAYDFLSRLFEKANQTLLLIDPYCDRETLSYCAKKKPNVSLTICLGLRSSLTNQDVTMFTKQYGPLTVKSTNLFHDRYLILDGFECYHLGASLNHAGRKVFTVDKVLDPDIVTLLINKAQ